VEVKKTERGELFFFGIGDDAVDDFFPLFIGIDASVTLAPVGEREILGIHEIPSPVRTSLEFILFGFLGHRTHIFSNCQLFASFLIYLLNRECEGTGSPLEVLFKPQDWNTSNSARVVFPFG